MIAFVVPPSFVEALLDLVLRVDGRTRSESSSAAPEWNRYGSPLIPRTNRYLSVKGEHAGMSRSLRFLSVIIPKNGVIANGCATGCYVNPMFYETTPSHQATKIASR